MIIKEREPTRRLLGRTFRRRLRLQQGEHLPRKRRIVLGATVLLSLLALFLATAVVSAFVGVELYRTNQLLRFRDFGRALIATNIDWPVHWIQGLRSRPKRLDFSVKHLDFQKLAYHRAVAWERGYLSDLEKSDWVPAELGFGGKNYRVDLRLRGLWLDHLQPDKWSFRIKVKGGEAVDGLRRFSIHHPAARNFLQEWIYQKYLGERGLIALQYDFVEVQINGKRHGVYALEEHFDRVLIERNQRREGLLFKPTYEDVAIYGEARNADNPTLAAQAAWLRRSYKALIRGELEVEQLVDVKKTAEYFAVTDLFAGHHGNLLDNYVYYFNPINGLIEPIGYDGNVGQVALSTLAGNFQSEYGARRSHLRPMFSYAPFYREYVQQLERLNLEELEKFRDSIDGELREKLGILYRSYPEYHFDTDYWASSLETIHKELNPEGKLKDVALSEPISGESVQLSVARNSSYPIELIGIFQNGSQISSDSETPVVVYPRSYDPNPSATARYEASFVLKQETVLDPTALQVGFRIPGSQRTATLPLSAEVIQPWIPSESLYPESIDLSGHPFLIVDTDERTIRFAAGHQEISRDVVLPAGYSVACAQGTTLDLVQGAKILSRSPVRFVGSEDFPITITSSDRTGQGITVMSAAGTSYLKHVVISHQTAPRLGGWQPTGAVTFYESPVDIELTTFEQSRAEDALNIVGTRFDIREATFRNNASDAFDADFTTGKISRSSFSEMGGDAIDFSGSEAELRQIVIRRIADKAVSVGEKSRVLIQGLAVSDSQVGVASKDLSEATLRDVSIESCRYGLAAFRKKSEMGGATLHAESLNLSSVEQSYLIDSISRITVDGVDVSVAPEDALALLYPPEDEP